MSQVSLDLVTVNVRPRRCERCGCLAPFVEPQAAADKRDLHEIALRHETMKFMSQLREITDCEIGNAKAVYAHIVKQRGVCHQCSHEIPIVEYTDCEHCKSFNIWWGDAK